MSRSFRHTPMLPVTGAPSDRPSKTRAHREERVAVRVALAADADMPGSKLFGDPWKGEKDGKHWWGKAVVADLRK